MPELFSSFSALPDDRMLTKDELANSIRFILSVEYEEIQLYLQCVDRESGCDSGFNCGVIDKQE